MKDFSHVHVQQMLMGAYKKVAQGREDINTINIFPVPDQDTGNNLTKTLKGVYEVLNAHAFEDIQTLKRVALDGALESAAGNIGIITTGFLNGFLAAFAEPTIKGEHIIKAFAHGSETAYTSVSHPQPGTVLDVMKYVASSLSQTEDSKMPVHVLEEALHLAKEALARTQQDMEILRKASVVDAGGYGFVLMIEGFLAGLHDPVTEVHAKEHVSYTPSHMIQILSQRYEVVSLVEQLLYSKDEIVTKLMPLGDCLDIVEANTKMKIHIHTDYPDDVVDLITSFGSVLHMKTSDMTLNHSALAEASHTRIGIVTDDAAGLDISFLAKHDITSVPFQYSWEGMNKNDMSDPDYVYRKMTELAHAKGVHVWPKTSQPSPKLFLDAFEEQLHKFQSVICFTISSGLSGSYNSALQARNMLRPELRERVFVTDFKQGSATQSYLIMAAVDLIKKEYEVSQILRQLDHIQKELHIVATPQDVVWIGRGGRVPPHKANLLGFLQMLGIQPLFGLKDGKIYLSKLMHKKKTISQTIHAHVIKKYPIQKTEKPPEVVIHHAHTPNLSAELKELLIHSGYRIMDEHVLAPVLGIHTGPESIIISVLY